MMARMMEASSFRRRLGMKFREHILGHFSMERYLNEHHETLWIAEAVYLNEIAGGGAVQAKAQLLSEQAKDQVGAEEAGKAGLEGGCRGQP
jgi:hypothetical protein